MWDFLRLFCLVGLPVFAVWSCVVWRPVLADPHPGKSVGIRVAQTVILLPLIAFFWPLAPLILWLIWKAPRRRPPPLADRLAWTWFAFGVSLMLTTTLHAVFQESEGSWRTLETIRRHTRLFLAVSIVPLVGPLAAYLMQKSSPKKGLKDPFDEPF